MAGLSCSIEMTNDIMIIPSLLQQLNFHEMDTFLDLLIVIQREDSNIDPNSCRKRETHTQ